MILFPFVYIFCDLCVPPTDLHMYRKRGRPSLAAGSRTITPRPSTSADLSDSVTDDEVSAQKYRRMRDLNNEASRRCRENRKTKQQLADMEIELQRAKNRQLKLELARLELKVTKLKSLVMNKVREPPAKTSAAPATPVPDFLEQLLQGASHDLPDTSSRWPRI